MHSPLLPSLSLFRGVSLAIVDYRVIWSLLAHCSLAPLSIVRSSTADSENRALVLVALAIARRGSIYPSLRTGGVSAWISRETNGRIMYETSRGNWNAKYQVGGCRIEQALSQIDSQANLLAT